MQALERFYQAAARKKDLQETLLRRGATTLRLRLSAPADEQGRLQASINAAEPNSGPNHRPGK
jgi:hypothetical protein